MLSWLFGKKDSAVAIAFFLCIAIASAKTGEVCFPFGSSEPSETPPQSIQGRPGKIGPRGPPGLQGEVGEPGSPGTCACDPNEIDQLREEIRLRDVRIEEVFNILRRVDRVLYCGVGLKDGRVKDDEISASSTYDNRYQAKFARLDRQGTNAHYGGWLGCITCRNPGEWIQVDLKIPTRVTAVVTQGLNELGNTMEWTTSYKISFGNTTTSMQVIQNPNGSDLIFDGNTDRDTHVTNEFPYPITARYFRLIVQTWMNWGVVRLEYLTC